MIREFSARKETDTELEKHLRQPHYYPAEGPACPFQDSFTHSSTGYSTEVLGVKEQNLSSMSKVHGLCLQRQRNRHQQSVKRQSCSVCLQEAKKTSAGRPGQMLLKVTKVKAVLLLCALQFQKGKLTVLSLYEGLPVFYSLFPGE